MRRAPIIRTACAFLCVGVALVAIDLVRVRPANPSQTLPLTQGETVRAEGLPFGLRLERVETVRTFDPRDLLKITSPESQTLFNIAEGQDVEFDGERFHVAAIRRWTGLLRGANGRPMAAVALRLDDNAWVDNVFVTAGSWVRIGSNIGVYLTWHDSERAARRQAQQGRPLRQYAHWGVAEGAEIQWVNSFLPGTGAQREDGTAVTLLQFDERHVAESYEGPAILVEIQRADTLERRWVPANVGDADALVQLDCPTNLETVVWLDAWRDGTALVTASHRQQPSGHTELAEGETWIPQNLPFGLRVDQVATSAVPIEAQNSSLTEAVITTPQRQLRLRQGEALTHNDLFLQFTRILPPPQVRCEIALFDADGKTQRTITLDSAQHLRLEGWDLACEPDEGRLNRITLHITPVPSRILAYLSVSFFLLGGLAAASGVLFAARRPARQ